jgi:hypothetical protein
VIEVGPWERSQGEDEFLLPFRGGARENLGKHGPANENRLPLKESVQIARRPSLALSQELDPHGCVR